MSHDPDEPPQSDTRPTSGLPESVSASHLSLDQAGRVVAVSAGCANLLGIDRARLLRRNLAPRLALASRPVFKQFLRRMYSEPSRQRCQAQFTRPNGTTCWTELEGAVTDPHKSPTAPRRIRLASIRGPTVAAEALRPLPALAASNAKFKREMLRRKQLEAALRQSERTQRELIEKSRVLQAQLRHLTRQVLLAQEEERKAISRDLHDEVAQILAGINVHLAVLKQETVIDRRRLRRRVAQTQRLVSHSVEIVHRYARQLRPAMLDDLGLIPAVRSFIKDLPRRQGLRVRFSASSEVEKLDNTRRTVLYRVTQEALTNVIRHARASVVTVRIQQTADTVRLHVHDDGKSFEPARVLASAGHRRLGLLGMRERLEMVGGRLVIESSPETGTSVCADVPTVREGEAAS